MRRNWAVVALCGLLLVAVAWLGADQEALTPEQIAWLQELGRSTGDAGAQKQAREKRPEWITGEFTRGALAWMDAQRLTPASAKELESAAQGAAHLAEVLGEKRLHGDALLAAGRFSYTSGDLGKAQTSYDVARRCYESVDHTLGIARCDINVGLILARQRKFTAALEKYGVAEAALSRLEGKEAKGFLARCRQNAGVAYHALGEAQKEAEMCQAAAAGFAEAGDLLNQAKALNSVMEAQISLQRPVDAIRTYFGAVRLLDESSPQQREVLAALENNAGKASHDLGLLYEANVAWEKALRLLPADGRAELKAQLRMNLGVLKNAVGDAEAALTQFDGALGVFRGANPVSEGKCLLNIGSAQIRLKTWDKAESSISEASSKFEELGDLRMKARCSLRLAYIALMQGQLEKALALYQEAGAGAENLGDRALKAMCFAGLGLTQEKLGKLAEAETWYAKGLEEACALRLGAEEAELAAKVGEGFAELPSDLAAVLIRQSKTEAAFEAAQRWKGSVVREALLAADGATKSLGEAEAKRYGELRQVLEQAEQTVRQTPTDDPGFRDRLSRQDEALRDLRLFEKSIAGRLPALTDARVSVAEIARQLGPDGILVEYLAGQDRLCIIAVSLRGGKARIVSKVATLDTARFRRSVVNYAAQLADSAGLSEALLAKQAEQLYAVLLGPMEAELTGKSRLVICPDQYLHGLPFTTLLDGKGRYVIERFAVATAPSAAAWKASRKVAAERRSGARGQIMLVARSQFEGQVREGDATRDSRFLNYQELPNVRREAQTVAAISGAAVRTLSEKEATVEAVKQAAPAARILHFATHASSNDTRPLYGHLVLAPKSAEDSGLLFAQDVLGMRLSAELAVLSACETAKGYVSGEGVIGLAWSFLVAGCPTTIATGWQLNDESAAVWVSEFYRGLLSQKQSKAESFRSACLKLLGTKGKQQDFSSPRRWGTWALVGDDS